MKKFFAIITLLALFLVVGCVDLDELWNEIDFLKKQNAEQAKELEEENAKFTAFEALLESVEQLTSSANSEITSIKGLVDALTNNLRVVSYKELADKSGYELTMSDGSKITLKHGTDGAAGKDGKDGADGQDGVDGVTPNISVKLHDDGLLYWTLDGEFMLDADGNMIPAQGKDGKDGKDGATGAAGAAGADGKDGITPLLRVNTNLYWEMSLDGGKTWQLVKDTKNNPIKAQGPTGQRGPAGKPGASGANGAPGTQGLPGDKGDPGKDGDPIVTITENYDYVIITYLGATYVVPKALPEQLFNPLSLVARYNVNQNGNAFVTSETSCTASGYFTFTQAVDQFTNIQIGDKYYHLPSESEWISIFPLDIRPEIPPHIPTHVVRFNSKNAGISNLSYNNITENVTVKGQDIAMTSDFRVNFNHVTYALRYKGTNMETAWKYERINQGSDTHLKVTSRIFYGMNITVDDIISADFWSSNNGNDVIRRFPAGGQYEYDLNSSYAEDVLYGVGTYGNYTSSTGTQDTYWFMTFGTLYLGYLDSWDDYRFRQTIRLFETVN